MPCILFKSSPILLTTYPHFIDEENEFQKSKRSLLQVTLGEGDFQDL